MMDLSAEVVQLKTVKPVHGGYCLAFAEGLTYLVSGALPGEVVEAQVTGGKKLMRYARTISVLEPSPHRISHIWPLAESSLIGGVDLGHVSFDYQSQWKTQVLLDSLQRLGGKTVADQLDQITPPTVENVSETDNQTQAAASRTRIEFEINDRGVPAMYAQKSNELVAIDCLALATEDIQALDLTAKTSPFQKLWQPGQRVRVASGDNGIKLAVGPNCFDGEGKPTDPIMRHHLRTDKKIFYEVAVTDFWQSHPAAPDILVQAVLSEVDAETECIWELYSGSGLFTVPLAKVSQNVLAVEGARSACKRAAINLKNNRVADGVKVETLSVNPQTINDLAHRYENPEAVVLDPPRSGAGLATIQQITELGAEKIIYIACDPAALARDLKAITANEYKIEKISAWNLFPFTHHFETVAVLSR